jgi:hypothetical protein
MFCDPVVVTWAFRHYVKQHKKQLVKSCHLPTSLYSSTFLFEKERALGSAVLIGLIRRTRSPLKFPPLQRKFSVRGSHGWLSRCGYLPLYRATADKWRTASEYVMLWVSQCGCWDGVCVFLVKLGVQTNFWRLHSFKCCHLYSEA